jgi:LPXTG-motif cell wall-anchored protein
MDKSENLAGAAFMGLVVLGGGSFMLLKKGKSK